MIAIKQTDRFDRLGNKVFELVVKKDNFQMIHDVTANELAMLKKMLDEFYDTGVFSDAI